MLNFEKFAGVGQFRPTPPSPEAGYPLVCLEPGQSLTETKVRLISKNIVVEKRVISWGLNPAVSGLVFAKEAARHKSSNNA